ncbi:MAG: M56 family metallopeptidase, partial [Planctomycetota bacterium]
MHSYLLPENEPWLELVLVLAVGTVVIVGLSAWADRILRSAVWQRTVWQVATLGLLVLMLVELTGTAPALVQLWHARTKSLSRDNVALRENSPARQGGVPGMPARPTPPSQAGLSANARMRISSSTSPQAATARPGEASPMAQEYPPLAWPSAAPTDLAWLDDVDFGDDDVGGRAFFVLLGEGARENETWDAPQQLLVPDEEPISTYPSTAAEAAAGTFPAGARGDATAATPAQRRMPASAFWWLGAIWAFGAAVIAAWAVCVRTLVFALWRRRTAASDGPLCERVARLARRLGIRRRVRVLEGVGLRAPVAFGSIRPTVAVPVTFADDFDRQQQGAVLAHELAHLAARDPAWQVVAGLLCAGLWWHPLAWWSRHKLHAASEAAADEASLLVPDGPDLLAACLVAMGRRLAPPRPLGWVSVEGPGFRSSLGRRVERLLNLRRRPWRAPGRGRLLLAKTTLPVALVILAVCCTAWARPQAALTEGGTTMQVLRTSWRQSLVAAALAMATAGCSDAMADAPPLDESSPGALTGDLADADGQLALLAEDEEGEARERDEREREDIEALEREERELDEAEAREREERERDESEAREREGPEWREWSVAEAERVRFTRELNKLEEKARDINRELEGLRDDQDAEARELLGALREVEGRMDAIRRELRGSEREGERRDLDERIRAELDARLRDLTQRGRELHGREAALERELEGLREDEHAEDVRQLKNMLEEVRGAAKRVEDEMHEIMRELGRRPERPRPDRPQPEREQLTRRLEELQAVIDRLDEEGRIEEAEVKEREAREIRQLL